MPGRVLGLLPLILMGCTFVGAEKVQDLKDALDADADGVTLATDCDDYDATRFPVDPEDWPDSDIPYDHIDNDCGGNNDTLQLDRVDVDGDGIPGVLYADYVAAHLAGGFALTTEGEVPWPQDVDTELVDCDDNNGQIHPQVTSDPAYDGVDQDCGGDNDFDSDGDGQMPATIDGDPTLPLVEAYMEATGIVIDLTDPDAFADCNDLDADVLRSDTFDAPYDGIDTDCDGLNDFDQDGDGYYPTYYVPLFNSFVANYHPDTDPEVGPLTWGPEPGTPAQTGDCLDAPHPLADLAAFPPEGVYPGAPEIWYDGVDSDCGIDPAGAPLANNNDFDQDGDGYIRTDDVLAFDTFVANWSGTPPAEVICAPPDCLFPATVPANLIRRGGDCDDENPAAAPGQIELLFDDADADCDERFNATPFGFSGMAWDAPVGPRIARTDHHYVIGTAARWVDLGASERSNPALFHLFEADAGFDAPTIRDTPWANTTSSFPLGLGLDVVGRPDRFWVASSHYTSAIISTNNRVILQERVFNSGSGDFYTTSTFSNQWVFDGFDVYADLFFDPTNTITVTDTTGEPALWLTTCGGGGRELPDLVPGASPSAFQFIAAEAPIAGSDTEKIIAEKVETTNLAEVCFHQSDAGGATGSTTVCDDVGCITYDIDLNAAPVDRVTLATNQPWQGRILREANRRDRSTNPAIQADPNLTRGLLILVNQANGFTVVDLSDGSQYDLLTEYTVLSADAMFRYDVLYIAAVVENPLPGGTNQILMGWTEDPGNALTTVDLPLFDIDTDFRHTPVGGCDPDVIGCTSGRNLEAQRISLLVDEDADPTDDRLAIAVSAFSLDEATLPADLTPFPQDAVGWLFMGFNGTPPLAD